MIRVNNPDLVLFVGEALVGNEAVDQLSNFNRALQDFSDAEVPRLIDGILLTKVSTVPRVTLAWRDAPGVRTDPGDGPHASFSQFDTIDDKVGAAISMTYTSRQPIVFLGTGQDLTDLRQLSVQSVVNTLLN